MDVKKIRWGVIGCGEATEKKSGPAFPLVEGSSVVAVMRRNAQKAKDYAKRHNIPKYYTDPLELLDDDEVNAVYIATPPSTHATYAIMAMKSGKPVYVEKPMAASSHTISCGIYVVRRRQLIELIEKSGEEGRFDFVKDVLIRYKDVKRIYGYPMDTYWSNIASVESYYDTNMDFLTPQVRNYFFREYPPVYSKVDDLPPAKYNPGSIVRNSLVSSGSIIGSARSCTSHGALSGWL